MHQGLGMDGFNALSEQRAVHALFECCPTVTMARDLAAGRPYADHAALFRYADALLFGLSESAVNRVLDACPTIGSRPGSIRSCAEQCAVSDTDPALMQTLRDAAAAYLHRFEFPFVMRIGQSSAATVLAAIGDRMHNDTETERKVMRNELARITRTRLERMLGPEDGYPNWW